MHNPNVIANKFVPEEYRQCSLSLMDNISDPNIKFDGSGICNYYYEYQDLEKKYVVKGDEGKQKIAKIAETIKADGKNKKYDCITGVSGGVDSTYLVYWAKQMGLRPLVVHFDNGWNSELATKNVENIISKLGFDLYTLVVDWEEFKDLQLAYLKASVVDIEALTDHAIIATLYRLAAENNIKYILSGYNMVTEATLPSYWVWNKTDHINIKDIHQKFGTKRLKTYPFFGMKARQFYNRVKGIQTIYPLNYMDYDKRRIKEIITRELDWRDYGGKHYESIWTRFYQGYILPVKFGIDKRKAHLSNLIYSGQLTKEEALTLIKEPIYPVDYLSVDYEFVLKKLGMDAGQFEQIMSLPRKEHDQFKVEVNLWEKNRVLKIIKSILTK